MIGDNIDESVAERLSSFQPSERHSLFPTDQKGNVKIDDIRMLLKDAKTIRARRSQAAFVMRQTDAAAGAVGSNKSNRGGKVEVGNPLFRATISTPSPDIELSTRISQPTTKRTF